MTLLSGRFWNEKLLQDVCAGLAEELSLSPDAPGGMIEFRRTLTLSFFFKFYLTVLKKLGKEDSEDVSVGPGKAEHVCAPVALVFQDLGSWPRQERTVDQVVNAPLLWMSKDRGGGTRDRA